MLDRAAAASPARAAGIGVALALANVKNLSLILGAKLLVDNL